MISTNADLARVLADDEYADDEGDATFAFVQLGLLRALVESNRDLLEACRGLLTFAVPLDPEAVEHVYAARRAIEKAAIR